jgi:hypothetical protein
MSALKLETSARPAWPNELTLEKHRQSVEPDVENAWAEAVERRPIESGTVTLLPALQRFPACRAEFT